MTATTTVATPGGERETERPLTLIGMTAQLVLFWGEHTLPAPRSLYANGEDRILTLNFGTREQLDAWFRALGPRLGHDEVRSQPYDNAGKPQTLHNAYCKRWGWSINLSATTPIVTEEPEHTLTSVEREALARATEDGKQLHDATAEDVGCACCEGRQFGFNADCPTCCPPTEDAHACGYRYVHELGYLAVDPLCPACRAKATEAAGYVRVDEAMATDAQQIREALDGKTTEAASEGDAS